MPEEKLFKAFARILEQLNKSPMRPELLREQIVRHCNVDDLLFLINIFDDLLKENHR